MNEQEAARVINKYIPQIILQDNIFNIGEEANNCRTLLLDYLAEYCSWEDWNDEVAVVSDFIECMTVEEFISFCCLYLHQEFKPVTHYVCYPIHFIGVD